jgi:hypothetical protein
MTADLRNLIAAWHHHDRLCRESPNNEVSDSSAEKAHDILFEVAELPATTADDLLDKLARRCVHRQHHARGVRRDGVRARVGLDVSRPRRGSPTRRKTTGYALNHPPGGGWRCWPRTLSAGLGRRPEKLVPHRPALSTLSAERQRRARHGEEQKRPTDSRPASRSRKTVSCGHCKVACHNRYSSERIGA